MMSRFARRLLPLLATLLASACGGSVQIAFGDFDGAGPDFLRGEGLLNLAITDSPVDGATAVIVQFTGVALKRAGDPEQVVPFAEPLSVDLLALQGGGSQPLLQNLRVRAGRYESLRLLVRSSPGSTDSFVTDTGGTRRPLSVPAEFQDSLRLSTGFNVPFNGVASFTLDMDLRKSVLAPQAQDSGYRLRPGLRLVDDSSAGAITGTVSPATLADASCPNPAAPASNVNVVYVFPGAGALPHDIDGSPAEPLATARAMRSGSGAWMYRVGQLAPGSYTIAFSCQGANDDPERSDSIVFLGARSAGVTAGSATPADF